ncbi:MAG: hypothetical protein WCA42_16105 [Desulfobacterales bacterium]
MERVLKEDDPSLLKTFTRHDLVEMLALPGKFAVFEDRTDESLISHEKMVKWLKKGGRL